MNDSAGIAVAGVLVAAVRIEDGQSAGRGLRADTTVDGQFAVAISRAADYLISVNINDNCTRYYNDGQLTTRDEAQLVPVTESGKKG